MSDKFFFEETNRLESVRVKQIHRLINIANLNVLVAVTAHLSGITDAARKL